MKFRLRCALLDHLWGPWQNVAELGLDERHCLRRGCSGYDNRDDGTGWMERQQVVETVARLRAARPIVGEELPAGLPKGVADGRERR